MIHVFFRTNPFEPGRTYHKFSVGVSLSEIVLQCKVPRQLVNRVDVILGDVVVPVSWLCHVFPKDETTINLVVVPGANLAGAGMSASSKRSLISIGFQFGGLLLGGQIGGTAGYLVGAGIGIGGALLANAIVPPPKQPRDKLDFGLAGSRNAAAPYEPIPKIYGMHRVFPPLAGQPFTEVVGHSQYMRMMFICGYGPLKLGDFKIGDTPLSEYEDVEIEVRSGKANDKPITLYSNTVFDEEVGVKLTLEAGWELRVTEENIDEFIVNLTFPQGLYESSEDRTLSARVDVRMQYRLLGTEKWNDIIPPSEIDLLDMLGFFQTLENLFDRMDEVNGQLQNVYDYLDTILQDDRWLPVGVLTSLQSWIGGLQDRLDDLTPEDIDQQAIVTTTTNILALLIEMLATFQGLTQGEDPPEGAPSPQQISNFATLVQFLGSLYDINYNYTQFLPSIEVLGFVTPFLKNFIHSIGLSPLFGSYPKGGFAIVDDHRGVVRRGYRVPVMKGQYEIRLRRVTKDNDGDGGGLFGDGGFLGGGGAFLGGLFGGGEGQIVDELYWTSVQSIRYAAPVTMDGLAMVALRIRASDQLNGVIDQFNCIAQAKIPVYDPDTETWDKQLTRNPAWAFADILCGDANKRPVPHNRLDIDRLVEWADHCEAKGWNYDVVIDKQSTVFQKLQDMTPIGRASFTMRDGKYSVVIDKPQTVPVQHFTPRNSFNFSISRVYLDRPHGIKIRFINPDSGWQEDERIVYDDGYDEINATKFETLTLEGTTSADVAWSHGRYFLAVSKLRPEIAELTVDVEHLVAERGDLVYVTHDVPIWGYSWGRIKELNLQGANLLSMSLDEKYVGNTQKNYVIRIRRVDGTSVQYDMTVEDLETSTAVLADPPVAVDANINIGDLYVIGLKNREMEEMIIKEIRPNPDLSATLLLIHHAPEVHDADDEEIPEFDSQITKPPDAIHARPPKPTIDYIISDDTALFVNHDGSLMSRIMVVTKPVQPNETVFPEHLQLQYRKSTTEGVVPEEGDDVKLSSTPEWITMPVFPYHLNVAYAAPVKDGELYDFRLRYLSRAGVTSEWVRIDDYQVIGKSTPPPNIHSFYIVDKTLKWSYPSPPLDFKGFQVRFKPGVLDTEVIPWESSDAAHMGFLTATELNISGLSHGTKTFMLRAFDTSGNASEIITLGVDFGDLLVDNLLFEEDHYDLEFPDTRTNSYRDVSDGYLVAEDIGEGFWVNNSNVFWTSNASLFWTGQYKAMSYETQFEVDASYVPCFLKLDIDTEGPWRKVKYRDHSQTTLWPSDLADDIWPIDMADNYWPMIGGYQSWPGIIWVDSARIIDFLVEIGDGSPQGKLMVFRILLDVPDISEYFNDLAVDNAGTRLPITKTYRAIKLVNLTVIDDPGTAVGAKVFDKDEVNGPLVYCLDITGATVDGTVDAAVIGY